MDLNKHLVNCPTCGQSVNGHVAIQAVKDDLSIVSALKKVIDLSMHKPIKQPPRISNNNHLFNTNKCITCGQQKPKRYN